LIFRTSPRKSVSLLPVDSSCTAHDADFNSLYLPAVEAITAGTLAAA
jgi:hypothetical protein